jgi:hypothetical protein
MTQPTSATSIAVGALICSFLSLALAATALAVAISH